jgi:hypothetical protein
MGYRAFKIWSPEGEAPPDSGWRPYSRTSTNQASRVLRFDERSFSTIDKILHENSDNSLTSSQFNEVIKVFQLSIGNVLVTTAASCGVGLSI